MWAGVANARPEQVHKSEQPRRRGQAVLLRQVGSLTESWQFLTLGKRKILGLILNSESVD